MGSTATSSRQSATAPLKEQGLFLAPVLSPHGRLGLQEPTDAVPMDAGLAERLRTAFACGSGHGLLALGADEVGSVLPPVWSYWRDLGARYVTAVCALPELAERTSKPPLPPPSDSELGPMAAAGPPMAGAEYLSATVLAGLWREIDTAFDADLADAGVPVQAFLKRRNPAWNLVGRVHFNLAENRKDEDAPFAFLATYTTRLSAAAKAQHLPLGEALQEYAGAGNRERLLSLLTPVQRAAEQCGWLKAMVEANEIYHPLRWTSAEALQFLRDVPALEGAGVVVRMPASWRMNRPARPQVKATVGGKAPSQLGLDAVLDFDMAVTLDGETLSAAEIRTLLAQSDGLALIRGKWVEVDHERLARTLEQFCLLSPLQGAPMITRLQTRRGRHRWHSVARRPRQTCGRRERPSGNHVADAPHVLPIGPRCAWKGGGQIFGAPVRGGEKVGQWSGGVVLLRGGVKPGHWVG